jgi:hypothetical protein
VLLVPLLTLPATLVLWQVWLIPQCRGVPGPAPSPYTCPGFSIAIALVPGVLNLVPFAWCRSEVGFVRHAALLAASLGALRWIVPIFLQGGHLPSVTIHPVDALLHGRISGGLWLLSLLLGGVVGLLSLRRRADEPPP